MTLLVLGILDFYSPLVFHSEKTQALPRTDNAFHEHAGWYIYQGARPYLDIWQIKVPFVAFELTTLIAFIAQGNVYAIHLISVLLMIAFSLALVLMGFNLIQRLTGNPMSGFVTGLALLIYPYTFHFALNGIRPKIIMMCLGFAALTFMVTDQWFWSGLLSSLAVGSWQVGIIFPLIILVETIWHKKQSKAHLWFFSGLISGIIGMLIPIFYWGAFESMITQTMIVPLLISDESLSLIGKITILLKDAPTIFLLMFLGLITSGIVAYKDCKKYWWITAGTIFFTIILSMDFDGGADLIPIVIFSSLSLGAGFNLIKRPFMPIMAALILLIIPFTHFQALSTKNIIGTVQERSLSFGPTRHQQKRANQFQEGRLSAKKLSYSDLFWYKLTFNSCHYRLPNAPTQRRWFKYIDKNLNVKTCGQFPPWTKLFKSSES